MSEKRRVSEVRTAWTDADANYLLTKGWEMWSTGVAVKDPVLPYQSRYFVLTKMSKDSRYAR